VVQSPDDITVVCVRLADDGDFPAVERIEFTTPNHFDEIFQLMTLLCIVIANCVLNAFFEMNTTLVSRSSCGVQSSQIRTDIQVTLISSSRGGRESNCRKLMYSLESVGCGKNRIDQCDKLM
jgi:hypothetical protein